jgi:transposase
MGRSRFTPEFKAEAVRQVLERGYTVKDVAERIGVSAHALYIWVRKARPGRSEADEVSMLKLENQKLKAELKRIEEERDILKKAAAYFAKDPE